MVLLAALLAAVAAEPAALAFREETAVVYDDAGVAKFRGTRDFVLKVGGNPKGKIVDFDMVKRRVKVSAKGEGLWILCNDLQPGVAACGAVPARPKQRRGSAGTVADQPLDRGLPSCPGDPRCPNGG